MFNNPLDHLAWRIRARSPTSPHQIINPLRIFSSSVVSSPLQADRLLDDYAVVRQTIGFAFGSPGLVNAEFDTIDFNTGIAKLSPIYIAITQPGYYILCGHIQSIIAGDDGLLSINGTIVARARADRNGEVINISAIVQCNPGDSILLSLNSTYPGMVAMGVGGFFPMLSVYGGQYA